MTAVVASAAGCALSGMILLEAVTFRHSRVLAASLAVYAAGDAISATEASHLVGLQPAYLSPVMIPGDTQSLPLAATFNNSSGSSIGISSYVQDDPSCPAQLSSHPWVPYAFHPDFVPSTGTDIVVGHAIPFDTTAQGLGTYRTNICIVETGGAATAVPVRLTVVSGNPIPLVGDMTAVAPNLIAAEIAPGDTGSIPLSATFQNNTGSPLNIVGYVQDDPACPGLVSTHDWIPLNTPIQGSVPAGSQGVVSGMIPVDATGLASGKLRTNICLHQSDPSVTSAIPVEMRVVALDDIFQDGFD